MVKYQRCHKYWSHSINCIPELHWTKSCQLRKNIKWVCFILAFANGKENVIKSNKTNNQDSYRLADTIGHRNRDVFALLLLALAFSIAFSFPGGLFDAVTYRSTQNVSNFLNRCFFFLPLTVSRKSLKRSCSNCLMRLTEFYCVP